MSQTSLLRHHRRLFLQGLCVPVRIGIRRETDKKILTSKVVNITATIPPGGSNTTFAVVSEPLTVPWLREEADEDYMVVVSLAKR